MTRRQASSSNKISARDFYEHYSGHKVRHLEALLPHLRGGDGDGASILWTAGDSTLDNKYWFHQTAPAVGPYHDVLSPPVSKCDVTYWINYRLFHRDSQTQHTRQQGSTSEPHSPQPVVAAINTAVEASTLNERTFKLRPQDVFLRDNLQRQDILVVSVGGNDVVLMPCPCTIASLACLLCMPSACVERGWSCGQVPIDDCCCGCGPSLCSCACACPPCLGYFRHLFGQRIQTYIQALTAKTKPAKILICMVYYPDERDRQGSWASPALGALGYNSNPARVQQMIRKVYENAISKIQIEGSQVIPVPLFRVLDGKNSADYVERVEPSPSGGRKIADLILDMIQDGSPRGSPTRETTASTNTPLMPPSVSYMRDR